MANGTQNGQGSAPGTSDQNQNGQTLKYPLTKMNFKVTIGGSTTSSALFTEVTGVEASTDVIEFRQGSSPSMSVVKIPGLVKHGNVTLKMGYISGTDMQTWALQCTADTRENFARKNIGIELLDTRASSANGGAGAGTWTLTEAWVTKYSGADLNASASEVAVESIELAYETLSYAGSTGTAGTGTGGTGTGGQG